MVSLRKVDNFAELSVKDTGLGIPECEFGRLFERFHRVERIASGRTIEGIGIGLAMVQELVRLHHGTIRVESKEGEGSNFIVQIPLGNSHLPRECLRLTPPPTRKRSITSNSLVDEATRLVAEGKHGDSTPSKAAQILLADDHADTRDFLVHLLNKWKLHVVGNGADALRVATTEVPDLIISDVMMPKMDGLTDRKSVV